VNCRRGAARKLARGAPKPPKNAGTAFSITNYFLVVDGEKPMKTFVSIAALTLLCGSALAQNTGPAPQTGMEKPSTTNGAKPDGSMDTTGMSATKGNIKRDKDSAPAPKNEKK
jgi:hypothetical protein